MGDCAETLSYMSKALDFRLLCGNSQEFCRGASMYTPKSTSWAGDLLITSEADYRQSRMKWVRGEGCTFQKTDPDPSGEAGECGEQRLRPSGAVDPVETGARTCDLNFAFDPPHPGEDVEFGNGWECKILASTNECGAMIDGGDVYYDAEATTKVQSLDGTYTFSCIGNPFVAFLDNRKTYSEDEDKGLMIAIKHPLTKRWKFTFTAEDGGRRTNFKDMQDITSQIVELLQAGGIEETDIILAGMI